MAKDRRSKAKKQQDMILDGLNVDIVRLEDQIKKDTEMVSILKYQVSNIERICKEQDDLQEDKTHASGSAVSAGEGEEAQE